MIKIKKGFISIEYVLIAGICLVVFVAFGTIFSSENDFRYRSVINVLSDDGVPINNPVILPVYTKETCFTKGSPGVILAYDASCGRDVWIPSVMAGQKVLSIASGAFRNKGIENVYLPEGLIDIGSSAFENNTIQHLSVPNSVKTIGSRAFFGNGLERLYLPNTMTFVGDQAFNGNMLSGAEAYIYEYTTTGMNRTKIISYGGANKDIVIPHGVTTIGAGAFNATGLKSVIVSNTVVSIEAEAFANNNLSYVEFRGNVPGLLGTSIFSGNMGLIANTVMVPTPQIDAYRLRAWSNFGIMPEAFY